MNNFIKIIIGFIALFSVGILIKINAEVIYSERTQKNYYENNNFLAQKEKTAIYELIDRTEIIKNQKNKPENISSRAAIAINLYSDEKFFSFNETIRWPIASITKLMSSVVAIENMNPTKEITLSYRAVETEGRAGRFVEGDIYLVEDLIYAMMVVSSNDASVALAESMPEGKFVLLMNQKADEIGMNNTRFIDPSGLSMLNQSSVSDLILLVEYIWDNHPEIFSVSAKNNVSIREINSRRSARLTNINPLAFNNNFLGGKTGTIPSADQNLISIFSVEKEPVLVIILGSDNREEEAKKIISFIQQ